MKYLASLPIRAARFVMPAVVALTLTGAAATAATAATAAAAPAKPASLARPAITFAWHPLTLINGWKSASKSTLVTGTPAWALSRGVVYLKGAVKQPNANPAGDEFAVLPKSARPTSVLYLQVFTVDDAPGVVQIDPDGAMYAYSDAVSANPPVFTSLSGVSYPTSALKRTKLNLEHGWASSQSAWDSGDPSLSISGGVVYLSGSMHSGGTSHIAALLPKAARPAQTMFIEVYTDAGNTGYLKILPTGQLEAFGGAAGEFTSLASVSYPAPGAKWHAFTMADAWKSAQAKEHTAAPSYTIINGVVYLNGSMYEAKNVNGVWAYLPAGVKTKADVLNFEVLTSGGNPGAIAITANGLGIAVSLPHGNAMAFTSLAGVAYPQSS